MAGAIMNETLRAGADYPIVPPLLSSGQNTLLRTHVPPTRKLIREGEIVMMETGAGYNNYYVCMGHSVICGRKPTKQMRDQYALARDEADMLRQLIRPGASVAEIARKLVPHALPHARAFMLRTNTEFSNSVATVRGSVSARSGMTPYLSANRASGCWSQTW